MSCSHRSLQREIEELKQQLKMSIDIGLHVLTTRIDNEESQEYTRILNEMKESL